MSENTLTYEEKVVVEVAISKRISQLIELIDFVKENGEDKLVAEYEKDLQNLKNSFDKLVRSYLKEDLYG